MLLIDLQANSYRPDLLELQRRLLAHKPAFVPRPSLLVVVLAETWTDSFCFAWRSDHVSSIAELGGKRQVDWPLVDVLELTRCSRSHDSELAQAFAELNATELEKKYLERVNRSGSLLLLPAADTIQLLDDLAESNARFLGVEAFRLFDDGGVQPAMEFSNISFGQVEKKDGKLELKSFRRDLRSNWKSDPNALSRTKELVQEGQSAGYDWFEVSVGDPDTGELLFFRAFEK